MQIQSHLGLPPISPSLLAQAYSVHPPAELASSTQPAPIASLDLLVAAVVAATPVAPHPAQDEDVIRATVGVPKSTKIIS